jgi:hypothetical protein
MNAKKKTAEQRRVSFLEFNNAHTISLDIHSMLRVFSLYNRGDGRICSHPRHFLCLLHCLFYCCFVSTFSQFLFLSMLVLVFYVLNHVLGTDDVRHNLSSLTIRISKLSWSPGHSKYTCVVNKIVATLSGGDRAHAHEVRYSRRW